MRASTEQRSLLEVLGGGTGGRGYVEPGFQHPETALCPQNSLPGLCSLYSPHFTRRALRSSFTLPARTSIKPLMFFLIFLSRGLGNSEWPEVLGEYSTLSTALTPVAVRKSYVVYISFIVPTRSFFQINFYSIIQARGLQINFKCLSLPNASCP